MNYTISAYINKNDDWCNYYSKEYIEAVRDELEGIHNRIGGVILANEKESKKFGVFQFNYSGFFLSTFSEGYQLINLSAPKLVKNNQGDIELYNLRTPDPT